MKRMIGAVLVMACGAAWAGGGQGGATSISGASAAAGAAAISGSVSGAAAVNGPVNALSGGNTLSASPSAQTGAVSNTYDSRAYALGMSALASSANACQGSTSILFFATTWTVKSCQAAALAEAMARTGFSQASQRNVLCGVEEVAAAASECR
jgi:hypothetical protein